MSFQFTPQSGAVGTSVTLVLSNAGYFITSVTFNGVNATYTTDGSGVVNTSVPPGATTGFIRVNFVAAGSETSAGQFTVTAPPANTTPSISSISPNTGTGGTNVSLTGTNLQNTNAASINGVPCLLLAVNPSLVVVSMPGNGTSGPILLSGSTGSASSPNFTYQVNANAPRVDGFTPTSGQVGTEVTITGLRFAAATQVLFNGVGASFTIVSDTTIRANAPAGAGTGRITVVNSSGPGTSTQNFSITNTVGAPTISSFTPSGGKAGDTVTINGLVLGTVTQVTFNGITAAFSILSGTQLRATVPNGVTTGLIGVTNPAGQAFSATAFTVTTPAPLPIVSFYNPSSGKAGDPVQINGTGFNGATSVVFGGNKPATPFSVSNGTIIFTTVPVGAISGPVVVTTPAGSSMNSPSFTVTTSPAPGTNPPSISRFSPTSGGAGLNVDIDGLAFIQVSSVTFGGVQATFTVESERRIKARVPSNAVSGPISVTTPGGVASSANPFNFINLVPVPPVIFSFTPASGAAGTSVTLTGDTLASVTQVKIGTIPCTITSALNESLTFVVSPTAQTGLISVTGPGGITSSATSFTVTGGTVPPPLSSSGKVKFSTFRAPAGTNFPNELPPSFKTQLGIDDQGKVKMVAGQQIVLSFKAVRDDNNADTVNLSLSEFISTSFTAVLSKTVVATLETFDITITAPSSASSTIGTEFSLRGIGTIPPPLEYIPFSIIVEVMPAVQILEAPDVQVSRCQSSPYTFTQIRRRFIAARQPVLENLPSGVTYTQPLTLVSSTPATDSMGGGVVETFSTLISCGAESPGTSLFKVKPDITGGNPADVKAPAVQGNLSILAGELTLAISGPKQRDYNPGSSDTVDFKVTSVSFLGVLETSISISVISGDGRVAPTFTVFLDTTKRLMPGEFLNGSINVNVPQDVSLGSYSLYIGLVSCNIVDPHEEVVLNVGSTQVLLEPQFPADFSVFSGELRILPMLIRRAPSYTDPINIIQDKLPASVNFSTVPSPLESSVQVASLRFQAGTVGSGSITPFGLTPKALLGGQAVGPRLPLELHYLPPTLGLRLLDDPVTLVAGEPAEILFKATGFQFLATGDALTLSFNPPIRFLGFTSQTFSFANKSTDLASIDVNLSTTTRIGTYTTFVVTSLVTNGVTRSMSFPPQPITFIVENPATT